MAIAVRQLGPLFCAEISGVDTGHPVDDATSGRSRPMIVG
jgi:hypothetical protein